MVLGTSCWMACHSILGDQKLNSVHLSLHENIMNVDEMDGKWKVETGPFFFFPSEISQFHSISIQTSTSAHGLCFWFLISIFPAIFQGHS